MEDGEDFLEEVCRFFFQLESGNESILCLTIRPIVWRGSRTKCMPKGLVSRCLFWMLGFRTTNRFSLKLSVKPAQLVICLQAKKLAEQKEKDR